MVSVAARSTSKTLHLVAFSASPVASSTSAKKPAMGSARNTQGVKQIEQGFETGVTKEALMGSAQGTQGGDQIEKSGTSTLRCCCDRGS